MAPAGEKAKARANLAALTLLRDLEAEGRPATGDEQAVLARWSGWGSLPGVFDPGNDRWAAERAQLAELLDEREWAAARLTTVNAHYTDASVVAGIWRGVEALGFTGGRALEPGCGAGNFIGLAPAGLAIAWTGVEKDVTTGRIARRLYPQADIRVEGFEDTRLPPGSYDLAIGNVPFGDFRLHDPVHNRGKHSIHNHFLVKSLDLVRPGGLVACLTSRWTLDAFSTSAREAMHERGELLGAIRLPSDAFVASAGTSVVCDLVIFRRRHPDETPERAPTWLHTAEVLTPAGIATVNGWFARHPQLVLGDLTLGHGMYGRDDVLVEATGELGPALDKAFDRLVALRPGSTRAEPAPAPVQVFPPPPVNTAAITGKEGSIHRDGGGFAQVTYGSPVPFEVKPAKDRAELGRLVDLRDTTHALLEVQARSNDDTEFLALQQRLGRQYDDYVSHHGPINRFRLVGTGRLDPETGEERQAKRRPALGGFRDDPDWPLVAALERFDPETQLAERAAIFARRVVAPRAPVSAAETPADALAVCLDELGRPDLDRVAALLGCSPTEARSSLGDLVWDDPVTEQLVTAAQYLSGDVRTKHAEALAAAAADPAQWQRNADALAEVLPPDLGPADIDARPGASWIPPRDVAAFVAEVLDARAEVSFSPLLAEWKIKVVDGSRRSVAMTSEWGTARMPAVALLEATANQRPVTVYDTDDDDKRVMNPQATIEAREKQDALVERFSRWVWEDPERAERLRAAYNERFNSHVLPRHDGSHLTLPGLAHHFSPHPHQRDAVWRITSEPTTLLAVPNGSKV